MPKTTTQTRPRPICKDSRRLDGEQSTGQLAERQAQTPKIRQQKIQEQSLEIVEFMVNEIRASLPKIGMIHDNEKEQAVHPLYKIIFQETIKRSLASDWDDDDSPFFKIGIEGFEPGQI